MPKLKKTERKRKTSKFREKVSMIKSFRNYVFLCILYMKPLLPFPYTKEREKTLKRYNWLSTGGKEKPPISEPKYTLRNRRFLFSSRG